MVVSLSWARLAGRGACRPVSARPEKGAGENRVKPKPDLRAASREVMVSSCVKGCHFSAARSALRRWMTEVPT